MPRYRVVDLRGATPVEHLVTASSVLDAARVALGESFIRRSPNGKVQAKVYFETKRGTSMVKVFRRASHNTASEAAAGNLHPGCSYNSSAG